jgi:Uncharacterised nucleotidyltransferase
VTESFRAAATKLAVDAQTCRVIAALREAHVEPILLKGPSIEHWLYRDGVDRPYSDTDLLVSERSLSEVQRVLAALGYSQRLLLPGTSPPPATDWIRGEGGSEVDLHTRMWGWGDSGTVWEALQSHCQSMRVATIEVRVLDDVARAVHVVTHALQPSLFEHWTEKKNADLQRALDQVPDDVWEQAAELAVRAGAADAFAVGLHLRPHGRELCARLGIVVPAELNSDITFALAETSGTGALVLEQFVRTRGVRARAAILRGRLLPPLAWAHFVVAQTGAEPRGRMSTYTRYWLHLARKTPGALRTWRSSHYSPDHARRSFRAQ